MSLIARAERTKKDTGIGTVRYRIVNRKFVRALHHTGTGTVQCSRPIRMIKNILDKT